MGMGRISDVVEPLCVRRACIFASRASGLSGGVCEPSSVSVASSSSSSVGDSRYAQPHLLGVPCS